MANARQGTSATKTRGDVSGAGRKLWKQKGHWPRAHRVAAFAALERRRQRSWTAAARLVLQHAEEDAPGRVASALSERVREGQCFCVDGWNWISRRRKIFRSRWQAGLEGKTLIVDSLDNENLMLSARNVRQRESGQQLWFEYLRPALSREAGAFAQAAPKSSSSCSAKESARKREGSLKEADRQAPKPQSRSESRR
jgi:hypothetical protein